MSDAHAPTPPAAGSHRYFTLLYTPAALRDELSTLFALADEIGSDPAVSADHSLAHVRLEWWRHEAERFARGEPQHPWLRSLLAHYPATATLNLLALVEAAAIDLATRTLSSGNGNALQRALFQLAASALCTQPLSAQLQTTLGELGAASQRLEHDPTDQEARDQLDLQLRNIGDTTQPQLAPLLVWLALAARRSHRGGPLLDSLTDNLIAWRAARRAAHGRFRLNQ